MFWTALLTLMPRCGRGKDCDFFAEGIQGLKHQTGHTVYLFVCVCVKEREREFVCEGESEGKIQAKMS